MRLFVKNYKRKVAVVLANGHTWTSKVNSAQTTAQPSPYWLDKGSMSKSIVNYNLVLD